MLNCTQQLSLKNSFDIPMRKINFSYSSYSKLVGY